MSRGPESNFWTQIRSNLPPKAFATRIENAHGGGVPDVHVVWDGLSFWCELKSTKVSSVDVSPHQVAWNLAYWARGGSCFFLVKTQATGFIHLFDGDKGLDLRKTGVSGTEGQRFEALGPMFDALRVRCEARCSAALRLGLGSAGSL